jgi:hypothetical protein
VSWQAELTTMTSVMNRIACSASAAAADGQAECAAFFFSAAMPGCSIAAAINAAIATARFIPSPTQVPPTSATIPRTPIFAR